MSYIEKLEWLSLEINYIVLILKKVANKPSNYELVMHLKKEWEQSIELYREDIEMEYFHSIFALSLEHLKILASNFNKMNLKHFSTFMIYIADTINTQLPKEIKIRKMFLQMRDHVEEIAPLVEIDPEVFLECMSKVVENSDAIAEIIDFQRIFK